MSAVTLDLWHTLLFLAPEDEEVYMVAQVAIAVAALREAPRVTGSPDLDDGALRTAFRREYIGAVEAAESGRTVTPAEQFARAARAAGRQPDVEAYLDALEERVSRTPFDRAPGAFELLATLRDAGHRVAVISNTVGEPGAFLRPVLRRMGFDELVERYTFSDEQPWTKPAPEIFLHTLHALSTPPGASVHVGDGWSDIEGARRAGYRATILFTGLQNYGSSYRALFVPTAPERTRPDWRVDRLEEVGALVDRILGPKAGGLP